MPKPIDLSTNQRNTIIHFLLENSSNGKPIRGKIQEASIKFSCSTRTVGRLWAAAKQQRVNHECMSSISRKRQYSRARKIPVDLEKIKCLALSKRATIRGLTGGINVEKVQCIDGLQLRVKFALDALMYDRGPNENVLKFQTMQNTVHIDEKWFQIMKTSHRFYLAKGEEELHRTCRSKNYIDKVMFMAAVARPIFNEDESVLFDGKIGIFPFTEMVPAKRSSKNRETCTLEMKSIQSITMPVIRSMFINELVPNIKLKWPEGVSKVIYIQQDNARPHIKDSDFDFKAVASSDGFDIRIVHQPPNSPNMNINDLGWFRAIQSIQHQSDCYNTQDLVKAVQESFEKLDAPKLNRVFITLQSCMLEVMKLKGKNCYRIPHIKKDYLERHGLLPITLEAPTDLVKESIDFLIENGAMDGIEDLIEQLGLNETMQGINQSGLCMV